MESDMQQQQQGDRNTRPKPRELPPDSPVRRLSAPDEPHRQRMLQMVEAVAQHYGDAIPIP